MKSLNLSVNDNVEPVDQAALINRLAVSCIVGRRVRGGGGGCKGFPVCSSLGGDCHVGQKKCIICNQLLDPFLLVAFFLNFGKLVSFTELSFLTVMKRC